MKRTSMIVVLMAVLAVFLCSGAPAAAEESHESALKQIRGKMLEVAQDNKELAVENARLKSVLVGLQLQVEGSEEELDNLKRQYPERVLPVSALSEDRAEAQTYLNDIAADNPVLREARELYLSGLDLSLSDEQRLRELYLFNLQYEIQVLGLDKGDLQVSLRHIEEQRQAEIEALNQEVDAVVNNEKNLRERGLILQKNTVKHPRDIELYKVENERLRQAIKRLRSQLK